MKKILGLVFVLMLVTACGNNKENYENLKLKELTSYSMDLRVNSSDNKVRDIIKLDNYKSNYKIAVNADSKIETIYIKDDVTYIMSDSKYKKTTKNIKYNNVDLVIESLNKITKTSKETKTTDYEGNYTLYKVSFDYSYIKKIIADTNLSDIKITKDIDGEIYVDAKRRVYQIIYRFNSATITATFYSVNEGREINFPTEISK